MRGRTKWVLLALGPIAVGLIVLLLRPGPRPPGARRHDSPMPPVPGYFEDVTPGSGIDFVHRNGEEAGLATILESLGGGVALIDHDGDGLLDLFFPGGGTFDGPDRKTIAGRPCKLYKNLGGFKFRDVTAAV